VYGCWRLLFRIFKYLFFAVILIITVGLVGLWHVWHTIRNSEDFLLHPMFIPSEYNSLKNSGDIYSKIRIVTTAGRTFKIPVAYIDYVGDRSKGDEGIILDYVLPDFKSELEFSRDEQNELLRIGNMAGMLVDAETKFAPLDRYVELQRRNIVDYEGIFYGLHKYTAPLRIPKYGSPWRHDDTYIERDLDGTVLSLVECSIPEQVIVHRCRSSFNDKGLRYKISFPFRELPNWKAHQQAASNFIDGFEIHNIEGGKQ